jgi:hypothetical protein
MRSQGFRASIEKFRSKTIIRLPFDPNEVWSVKDTHHISGSVNGFAYRGPLGLDQEGYYLQLGPAWRKEHGLEVGTSVEVELSPEGPQISSLAQDITVALDSEPEAKNFFVSLATFYRKGYLRWIDGARRPETRAARIREMVDLLKAGKKQRG